uniref:Uncharacterized protein n=1 Tax=Arundo donax TaxID=35708 RepID=A0A0A9BZU5_ARUDO
MACRIMSCMLYLIGLNHMKLTHCILSG